MGESIEVVFVIVILSLQVISLSSEARVLIQIVINQSHYPSAEAYLANRQFLMIHSFSSLSGIRIGSMVSSEQMDSFFES